jgi:O-antigen ligase/polysaccharide polymerase Wzy-like membrane protein
LLNLRRIAPFLPGGDSDGSWGDGGGDRPPVGASTIPAGAVAIGATVLVSVALGAAAAASPFAAVGVAAALAGIALLAIGKAMVPLFHVALVGILAGYAFLGRGVAHLGVPPIYVGEMVLAMGLIAIAVSAGTARWRWAHVAILAFAAWGAVRTVPYVGIYGVDALRDAVTWGYAVFAIAVSLTVRAEHFDVIVRIYRRLVPVFVFWVPVAAVVSVVFVGILPRAPGSEVPILVFKGGDMGVHLAGAGAFMILGLGGSSVVGLREAVIWAGWLLSVVTAGAVNRGGLLAASMVATTVLFMRATMRWFLLAFVGLFLVAIVGLADPQVDLGFDRRISLDQVVDNVASIFDSHPDEALEGTKTWRLRWWNTIIGYTIDGRHFWDGKGYGINLADDDGFQLLADHSLRAPHNGHIEILARSGVPGLGLWILLQVVVGLTLVRAAFRARSAGMGHWVAIVGWIFAYWLAALVNASFDVYLQGPQGGIWFWSVMGLGIAAATAIDTLIDGPARADVAPKRPLSAMGSLAIR